MRISALLFIVTTGQQFLIATPCTKEPTKTNSLLLFIAEAFIDITCMISGMIALPACGLLQFLCIGHCLLLYI